MKKGMLSLVLSLAVLAAMPMSVSAETMQGSEDWAVTFDGSKMESNFGSSQLDEVIYGMQPGDTAELQITVTNKHSKDTNWYMSNEILRSLEESDSEAHGGAYAYHLTYTAADGTETELYNSDTVGGDETVGGEGLHQATNSLEEYFYLDRLASGKSGVVKLDVTLEGETLGNDYQNTLAQTQMTFAAEEASDGGTTTVSGPSKNITTVRTGDQSRTMLYISLAALAAGCIVLILVLRKFRRDEEEDSVETAERSRRRNRRGDR